MNRTLYLILTFLIIILSSCEKDVIEEPKPVPAERVNRTILVYIVGDNGSYDLSSSLMKNFEDMKLGLESIITDDCNLIVYSEMENDVPHLIQLSNLGNGVKADTLFTYEERNPLSKDVMSDVIKQTVTLFPAESYGFVFLSHSASWTPATSPAMRSIGQYRNTEMDLPVFCDVMTTAFPC